MLALLVVALVPACGGGAASSVSQPSTPAPVPDPLVERGDVVVVRADRSIAAVSKAGDESSVLATLPAGAGEPDAVAVSEDGRLVLVSAVQYDDDDSTVCSAAVLQVLPDKRLRELAEGASLALAADGSRLAYFRYADSDGFCRRTELVVRDLKDGSEAVVAKPDDGLVGGTPSEWPVNWSPDGEQIAHVTQVGAVVTTVSTGQTQVLEAAPMTRALAPAWLGDGRLVALHGCCLGSVSIRAAASGDEVFVAPAALRSLRADRGGSGAWLTVEGQGLHHWDGTAIRPVHPDAQLASG